MGTLLARVHDRLQAYAPRLSLAIIGFMVVLFVLVSVGVGYFSLISLAEELPHKAELQYTSYSAIDSGGGSVVPASCDSIPPSPHYGECTTQYYCGSSPHTCNGYFPYVIYSSPSTWTDTSTEYRWICREDQTAGDPSGFTPTDYYCAAPKNVPTTLPTTPSNPTGSCTSGTATLTWTPPSSWGSPQDNLLYKLEVRNTDNNTLWSPTIGGSLNSYSFGGGTLGGSNYVWTIKACNAGGCSADVSGSSFSCLVPPTPPKNPSTQCIYGTGTTSARFVWEAPDSWGFPSNGRYFDFLAANTRTGQVWSATTTGAARSYRIDNIGTDTIDWWISVCNRRSCSTVVAGPSAVCAGTPTDVPTNLTVSCVDDGSGVTGTATFDWSDVIGAADYHLRVRLNGGPNFTACTPYYISPSTGLWCWNEGITTSGHQITDIPLSDTKTYDWWVHADNAAGTGPASNGPDFKCLPPSAPPPPPPPPPPSTQPPTVSVTVDPGIGIFYSHNVVAAPGATVKIKWETTNNPTTCTAAATPADSEFDGSVATGGDTDSTVTEPALGTSRTYKVTCSNSAGSATDEVTVWTFNPNATLDLRAQPPLIRKGQPATLSWTVTADYPLTCTVVGSGVDVEFDHLGVSSGNTTTSGTYGISNLMNTSTYTLNCVPGPTLPIPPPDQERVRVEVTADVEER